MQFLLLIPLLLIEYTSKDGWEWCWSLVCFVGFGVRVVVGSCVWGLLLILFGSRARVVFEDCVWGFILRVTHILAAGQSFCHAWSLVDVKTAQGLVRTSHSCLYTGYVVVGLPELFYMLVKVWLSCVLVVWFLCFQISILVGIFSISHFEC